MRSSTGELAELPGGLGRQEWVLTFPQTSTNADPAPGLNVNPVRR